MPLSDFGSHGPDFSPEQVAQCRRIVSAVRTLNQQVIRLSGSEAELSRVADELEAQTRSLEAVSGRRAMETFRFRFDPGDPIVVMPFNPATGAFNPVAPEMAMSWEKDRLVVRLTFPANYESAPDTVQGGMVSALYDQVLAYAVMGHGKTGPTVWVRTRFLKRTPIEQPLRFEGWVESVEGEQYSMRGECFHGDVKVSEADGLVLGKYDMSRTGDPEPTPE